ncbi:hypothetical protein O181_031137 [Austropuccinia psidii MF-1]|uniref:Uncharacterized protein n=1 Tax=Austropuccinia psidii MF-1 TaxID=1389203 RepID=A0A9Q3CX19_9BASI|nr:hypothetical protein [Austropuccinia psidii MF-1]
MTLNSFAYPLITALNIVPRFNILPSSEDQQASGTTRNITAKGRTQHCAHPGSSSDMRVLALAPLSQMHDTNDRSSEQVCGRVRRSRTRPIYWA